MTATEWIAFDDGFRVIPDGLLFDPSVSPAAVRLYGIIKTFGGTNRTAWPGLPGIADRIAAHGGERPSERTLKRWMAELVAAGWVTRQRRWGTSSLTFLASTKGQQIPSTLAASPPPPADSGDKNGPIDGDKNGPTVGTKMAPLKEREKEEREEGETTRAKRPATRSTVTPAGERGQATQSRKRKPLHADTDTVAAHVWEHRPRRTASWHQIRSVASALLTAGHDAATVQQAMVDAPTVSVGAVEVQLGRRQGTSRRNRAVRRATVDYATEPV